MTDRNTPRLRRWRVRLAMKSGTSSGDAAQAMACPRRSKHGSDPATCGTDRRWRARDCGHSAIISAGSAALGYDTPGRVRAAVAYSIMTVFDSCRPVIRRSGLATATPAATGSPTMAFDTRALPAYLGYRNIQNTTPTPR